MNAFRQVSVLFSALGASILIAGCGGPGPAEEPSTEEAATTGAEEEASASDEIPSPPADWESMSHADRAAWMGDEVMPRMEGLFAEFDAERYGDFSCRTCHGPDPAGVNFEMPSAALPALPATGSPEQEQMVREYGPMLRFMYSHVVPSMQTLVGGQDYDEETQEGFSCFACHPHQGDEGSTLVRLGEPAAE